MKGMKRLAILLGTLVAFAQGFLVETGPGGCHPNPCPPNHLCHDLSQDQTGEEGIDCQPFIPNPCIGAPCGLDLECVVDPTRPGGFSCTPGLCRFWTCPTGATCVSTPEVPLSCLCPEPNQTYNIVTNSCDSSAAPPPTPAPRPCIPSPCGPGVFSTFGLTFSCNCDGTGYHGSFCDQRTQCSGKTEANAVWSTTDSLGTATGKCQAGFQGNATRTCQENGQFGPVQGGCFAPCPAAIVGTAAFNQTAPGQVAHGLCQKGFAGNPSRPCTAEGTWGSVSSPCTAIVCAALKDKVANFPQANAGASSTGKCLKGTGTITRFCGWNGQFEAAKGVCK